MFDLFRFITVRPPQELEESRSIPSDTKSDFQSTLFGTDNRRRQKAVAIDFIESAGFVTGWIDLKRLGEDLLFLGRERTSGEKRLESVASRPEPSRPHFGTGGHSRACATSRGTA